MNKKFLWQFEIPREGDLGGAPAPTPDPTPAPAPVAVDPAPTPANPTPTPAPTPELAPTPAPQMISQDVFQQRIAQLTAQRRELEERLAAQARNAPPPQDPTPQDPSPRSPTQQELDAEISRRAMEVADARVFNDKANAINSAGISKYQDFGQSVVAINTTFGQMPRDFIEQVAAAGGNDAEAAEIFYALGRDLNAAGQIITLPPSVRAVKLVEFATKLKSGRAPKTPAPSNAPAPITPVVGNGAANGPVDLSDPKLPMEEFARNRREKWKKTGRWR